MLCRLQTQPVKCLSVKRTHEDLGRKAFWRIKQTGPVLPQKDAACGSRAITAAGRVTLRLGTHLADHGAPVADQLGQHHGHVVVDGGGVVGPLCRVAHKRAKGKDCCAAHLQEGWEPSLHRPPRLALLLGQGGTLGLSSRGCASEGRTGRAGPFLDARKHPGRSRPLLEAQSQRRPFQHASAGPPAPAGPLALV